MLRFHISNQQQRDTFDHAAGPVEFGRRPKTDDISRCVVQDLSVARDHARVEALPNGLVRVHNLTEKRQVLVSDNTTVPPGESRDVGVPVRLTIGRTFVEVEPASGEANQELLKTIARPLRTGQAVDLSTTLMSLGGSPSA